MRRARALAELIEPCLGKSVAKQGFSSADIVVSWPEIVGEQLGAMSMPVKVDWPRRPRDGTGPATTPGTLVIRAESASALELQHLAPVLIERVNAFYGWRCIGRLVIKQGPVRRPSQPGLKPRQLAAAERARLDGALAGVAEDGLRSALDRLGAAVVASCEPASAPRT